MALALEFAPLLIGVPIDPPLSLVVAVVLGGLMATRPAPAWPIVCAGVAMLVTAKTLSIPPEVLALAKVPSLPQPTVRPYRLAARRSRPTLTPQPTFQASVLPVA